MDVISKQVIPQLANALPAKGQKLPGQQRDTVYFAGNAGASQPPAPQASLPVVPEPFAFLDPVMPRPGSFSERMRVGKLLLKLGWQRLMWDVFKATTKEAPVWVPDEDHGAERQRLIKQGYHALSKGKLEAYLVATRLTLRYPYDGFTASGLFTTYQSLADGLKRIAEDAEWAKSATDEHIQKRVHDHRYGAKAMVRYGDGSDKFRTAAYYKALRVNANQTDGINWTALSNACYQNAVTYYENLPPVQKSHENYYIRLARLHKDYGQTEKALAALDMEVSRLSSHSQEIMQGVNRRQVALLYQELKAPEKALPHFEALLAEAKTTQTAGLFLADLHSHAGHCYELLGSLGKAKEHYQAAFRAAPGNAEYAKNFARLSTGGVV
ncbi:MAG: tetratricopeptide repeat protein [Cyanobacteria bacterium]|nr:tetratricopeptide repeat protein [Cyanobacteriota bacterium]